MTSFDSTNMYEYFIAQYDIQLEEHKIRHCSQHKPESVCFGLS